MTSSLGLNKTPLYMYMPCFLYSSIDELIPYLGYCEQRRSKHEYSSVWEVDFGYFGYILRYSGVQ
jgi:hypothetical protein